MDGYVGSEMNGEMNTGADECPRPYSCVCPFVCLCICLGFHFKDILVQSGNYVYVKL